MLLLGIQFLTANISRCSRIAVIDHIVTVTVILAFNIAIILAIILAVILAVNIAVNIVVIVNVVIDH
jgi:hypothetical protein